MVSIRQCLRVGLTIVGLLYADDPTAQAPDTVMIAASEARHPPKNPRGWLVVKRLIRSVIYLIKQATRVRSYMLN